MPIALASTVTVGSGEAAAIEFSSIAQTGKDLMIVVSARNNPTGAVTDFFNLSFNGSTSGFSTRGIYGSGSFTGSFTSPSNFGSESVGSVATSNTFSNSQIYISNYTSSVAKSYSTDGVGENNGTTANQTMSAGSWSGTAAITSVMLTPQNGNFAQHTTVSLYIVDVATATATGSIPAPKATGGTITFSGGFWVHTFTSSGTFTPTQNLTDVEYLVIAGGGGGGGGNSGGGAGGGGAGGYRTSVVGQTSGGGSSAEARLSLTAGQSYTVTVGAGGAADMGSRGGSGTNSTFASITSNGGGGGGGQFPGPSNGATGGSGGGSMYGDNTQAAGTSGQGFSGGAAQLSNSTIRLGGGGGGAGSLADPAVPNNSTQVANGGAGLSNNITGTAVFRGGGGGAGNWYPNSGDPRSQGGNGGGGRGGSRQFFSEAGTANTGGGGGGGAGAGAAGGSGIVIVRYAA